MGSRRLAFSSPGSASNREGRAAYPRDGPGSWDGGGRGFGAWREQMTTNYKSTFIAVAPDSPTTCATAPKPGTVGAMQLEMLLDRPYGFTSDDLLFEVHARRNGIAPAQRDGERVTFLSKPRACLRASSLVKQQGWGLHHDEGGRVAAYGVGTPEYRRLVSDPELKHVRGMRNRRGRAAPL